MSGILIDVGQSNTSFEGTVASIDLDVTIDENHEWVNDITSSPVESGAPITDHIQPLNDRLSITGMVSNASISDSVLQALDVDTDRVQTAYDALRMLKEERTLVTVYTRYEIYTDMAVSRVNIPRNNQVGEAIQFTVEFQKVRIVDTQTVDVPDGISRKLDKKEGGATGAVAKKAQPQKKGGAVANKEQDNGSILSTIGPKVLDKAKGAIEAISSGIGGL